MNKNIIHIVTLTVGIAAFSANSLAGGLIADGLQATGLISPQQAEALDRGHDNFKRSVPAYGALEEAGSAVVRNGVRAYAVQQTGPMGLMAGDMVANGMRARLDADRRAAISRSRDFDQYRYQQYGPQRVYPGERVAVSNYDRSYDQYNRPQYQQQGGRTFGRGLDMTPPYQLPPPPPVYRR